MPSIYLLNTLRTLAMLSSSPLLHLTPHWVLKSWGSWTREKTVLSAVPYVPPSFFQAKHVTYYRSYAKVSKKVYLEGAELAIFEAKERRRLRAEAENKAKELEEAAMEDMMMGIEDYESDTEERDNGTAAYPTCL